MAADGTLLASYGEVHGARVSVAELPPHLPLAVLAVEDRRFYQHGGVDFRGLLRASLANLRAGRIVQGGSTVTQQLAKNLFLTPERTLKRKIQELLLALWLERRFTKDQILALYLNRVYLGAGTFGVDAAARRYFDKPVAEVNLYEAALLAGLLKAPSRYNPTRNKDRAARRTSQVLTAMTDAGFITADEAAQARREKTHGRAAAGAQARYFSDWVLAQVSAYIGPADRDLTVITTLNPAYQRIAEAELAALLDGEGRNRRVGQGALVLMDPGGAVRAMVGGRSYDTSQFNRATQALRQPGSAFKAVRLSGRPGKTACGPTTSSMTPGSRLRAGRRATMAASTSAELPCARPSRARSIRSRCGSANGPAATGSWPPPGAWASPRSWPPVPRSRSAPRR